MCVMAAGITASVALKHAGRTHIAVVACVVDGQEVASARCSLALVAVLAAARLSLHGAGVVGTAGQLHCLLNHTASHSGHVGHGVTAHMEGERL